MGPGGKGPLLERLDDLGLSCLVYDGEGLGGGLEGTPSATEVLETRARTSCRIAYRYGIRCCSPLMRRPLQGRWVATRRQALIPYITIKTEWWTTIGNEGKSDLYIIAREGWKDR